MKKSIAFLLLACFGCTSAPKKATIHIGLVDSNRSLKIMGLDYAIAGEISRDSVPGAWQSLMPVYRMPADTDMKDYQQPQPGRYQLKDSTIIFTPDTPFVNKQTYFLRYFNFGENGGTADLLKGKKSISHTPYVDLVFKQDGE